MEISKKEKLPKYNANTDWIAFVLVSLIAFSPRIARWFYPEVWMEDSAYIYHAFSMMSGQQPFIDSIYAHPPVFEELLALFYSIFGVSYRVAETLSSLVMILTTFCIYGLCKKETNKWIALAGAAAFSVSPLLFRYHVFEREVFTVMLASLAFLIVQKRKDSLIGALLAGILAGLAMSIKISGGFLILPLALVFILRKDRKLFLLCILAWTATGGGIWLYYLSKYGYLAFSQLILIHFVKGETLAFWENIRTVFIPNLNYLLVFGTGGLLIGLGQTQNSIKISLVAFAIQHFLFFGIISGTIWPHNMIDLLLPLSVGICYGLKELLQIFRSDDNQKLRSLYIVTPAVAFILLGAINEKNLTGGWGYLSREKIAEAVSFIRANVPPSAEIIAPHYIAADAKRKKLIDYRELYGPYLWMLRSIDQNGYLSLKKQKQFKSWKIMVWQTIPLWFPTVEEAVRSNKVDAIIWDFVFPEWHLFQKIESSFEKQTGFISESGYVVRYRDGPYVIWLKKLKNNN